jgi:hypothetical protein
MINIVYSHSEYFDVLEIFLDQWNQFYGSEILICADKKYKNEKTILYNNELSYSEKLLNCINQIKENIIFFHHEDMLIYDKPNINLLNEYQNILINSKKDFIRLTRAPGNCIFSQSSERKTLFNISEKSEYVFCIQPSIWKRESLQKFLDSSGKLNIWQLEERSSIINEKVKISGLCHFNDEPKRGGHYDSNVWPYIASATIKGKWNFTEYENELNKIKKILNNKRGRI